ncbi:MAG: tetratricopeptide repeat protein [Phycisphaerae bacterium]
MADSLIRTGISKTVIVCALVGSAMLIAGCASRGMQLRDQGVALYHQHQYAKSFTALNASMQYNPTSAEANYYAGMIEYAKQNYELAAYHFKVTWTADPHYPHVKTALANTYLKMGEPNTAMNFLERDAELTGSVAGRLRVARFYQKIGDLDDARLNYEKAAAMAPTDLHILMTTAEFLDSVGDRTAAGEYYAKAYRLAPTTPGLVAKMEADGVTVADALAPATQP